VTVRLVEVMEVPGEIRLRFSFRPRYEARQAVAAAGLRWDPSCRFYRRAWAWNDDRAARRALVRDAIALAGPLARSSQGAPAPVRVRWHGPC